MQDMLPEFGTPATLDEWIMLTQEAQATMMRYALDLRSITKGRGRFSQKVAHYDEMPANEQQILVQEYLKAKADKED